MGRSTGIEPANTGTTTRGLNHLATTATHYCINVKETWTNVKWFFVMAYIKVMCLRYSGEDFRSAEMMQCLFLTLLCQFLTLFYFIHGFSSYGIT
jgi:uncharacterized membrane protein SirB2